jgi:hypothetical protein
MHLNKEKTVDVTASGHKVILKPIDEGEKKQLAYVFSQMTQGEEIQGHGSPDSICIGTTYLVFQSNNWGRGLVILPHNDRSSSFHILLLARRLLHPLTRLHFDHYSEATSEVVLIEESIFET